MRVTLLSIFAGWAAVELVSANDVMLLSGGSMFVHEYLWASSVYSLIGLASGEGRVSVIGAHLRESFDIGAWARGEQLFGGCSLPGLGSSGVLFCPRTRPRLRIT